ncbi:F-type H+-transporting ATPase subunit alpha [Tistlia consotensis]|uniref:ATP synthase subunit alpha n=1 Tax=Tistlia consotensis USBA 355 TaxID=560819 RepID=A0A1Y6CXA5_9PROT|nr:F0F1 ATP synthase subunit alpha [Tistlia consotensis]SMF81328.1 F-type H+-transporting ATPase subunit alpha [Tistlia consotensis USBA 355]SNS22910.1 F-type H+-transporting ATPase subunit alpha [Tistlia consotensis]
MTSPSSPDGGTGAPLGAALADWRRSAERRLAEKPAGPRLEETGRVERIGDGIALVSGLDGARAEELLAFPGGVVGLAWTFDAERIGCVLLDPPGALEAGDLVQATGRVASLPVGEALLGRIVDPLGRPLDGGPAIRGERFAPMEQPAPGIIERDLVKVPLETGLTVIDGLFAIGRGQRELIIGDRSTGKTALAVDTIINQKDSGVVSVYVAVGQRSSSVGRVIDAVRSHGNAERTVFVVAEADAPPGQQWLAPFAGFSIAEFFRDRGEDALVVVDDLSKHAAVHRQISLLLRQPPGREAFPGDVFYLHARLLERAAKLSKERGGGSLTALPVAETQAGNLTAYIPTNLISITDGQIYLDARLFGEGQKPAVDVGRSVSRVGGKTQRPALRAAAAGLRLDYAQFLELELFSRFGTVSDPRTRRTLEHGRRIRAVLAQDQYAPLGETTQVALLLALGAGQLDALTPGQIARFRVRLAEALTGPPVEASDEAAKAALLERTAALVAEIAGSAPAGAAAPAEPAAEAAG